MKRAHVLNPTLSGFACIRCRTDLALGDYFEGCPRCQARGEPSSIRSVFRASPEELSDPLRRGMDRYAAWMPYTSWVSLGEGGTSCASFPSLADEVQAGPVYISTLR